MSPARLRLTMRGRVQGVGFRPTFYRAAAARELKGTIANTDEGVIADLEGAQSALQDLRDNLEKIIPAQAQLDEVLAEWLEQPAHYAELIIIASVDRQNRGARIPADLATCKECVAELFDKQDRRHRYPFINCINCGPRLTIIEAIPYDRPLTCMREFTLCPACEQEYRDVFNRRYHAEPIACETCGPHLQLVDNEGNIVEGEPISQTARLLRAGKIVALKGVGGFHLAADARNEAAVSLLRQRKGRELKPLAVMVADLPEGQKHAQIDEQAQQLLTSVIAPIVLLRRNEQNDLAPAVAPENPFLGLMLPYSPIHHLLLREITALVMTSGNLSEEPIAITNKEARERLAGIADYFLLHNREILLAVDDSVISHSSLGPTLIRRSRGYVPDPVRLNFDAGQILAVGGQLKNTFCLTCGHDAFLGPHIGDLDNQESYEHFLRGLEHMQKLLRLKPTAVVHDLHPDYVTTRFAEQTGLPRLGVQHHHAHLAAVAADVGLTKPAIGLALDGTGFGEDGTIWGGELLYLPQPGQYRRAGHLRPFPLPGGETCIKHPWRTALGLAHTWLGEIEAERAARLLTISENERQVITALINKKLNTISTSSLGRLFDAVAALCGLAARVTYEGQPAMELEFIAADEKTLKIDEEYHLEVQEGEVLLLDPSLALAEILDDLQSKTPAKLVAAKFHAGLSSALANWCQLAARRTSTKDVLLGGGCLQNRFLAASLVRKLRQRELIPHLPRRIPPNDGGLALGQAALYAASLETSHS